MKNIMAHNPINNSNNQKNQNYNNGSAHPNSFHELNNPMYSYSFNSYPNINNNPNNSNSNDYYYFNSQNSLSYAPESNSNSNPQFKSYGMNGSYFNNPKNWRFLVRN